MPNERNGRRRSGVKNKRITKESLIHYIKLIPKYFVIEPLIALWILPSCFFLVPIQNLNLEKACRINLGYNKLICDNVLDKNETLDCSIYTEDFQNSTITNDITFDITEEWSNFSYAVCKAERTTQKTLNITYGIRGPISAIFQILVILYAGGLSDKYNKKKPLMFLPLIGELLSAAAFLVSSIFFDDLPMEFTSYLEKILPGLFGGPTLMVMGVYSYLVATTKEEDRVFRLGIFGMFLTIVTIIGSPFSGQLYTDLGYVKVFALGCILLICGIVYLIFCIKEVEDTEQKDIKKEKFGCREGLLVAYDSLKVVAKKRENNGRVYLILLSICYLLIIGPTTGEADYLIEYCLIKLNWKVDQISYFITFAQAITTVGTFIMTTVLSKMLKVTDSMIGFLSSVSSIIARVLFAFAKDSITYYAGGVMDMFVTARTIALKTTVSLFVLPEELGRVYSVLGIADALGTFIFTPIYSVVYNKTIDYFPGAFYLFSEIFFVPSGIIFFICYLLLRNRKPLIPDPEEKAENGIDNKAMDDKNPDTMDTHL